MTICSELRAGISRLSISAHPNRKRVEQIRVELRASKERAAINQLIWLRSIESDLAQGNRISANLLFEVVVLCVPQAGYETRSEGAF